MKLGSLFKRPWIAAATSAILVAAGLSLTAVDTAQAAAGCQVDYTISSQWPGGFGANVQITNLGNPISTWTLSWSFTAGQTIQTLWNGTYTQTGGNVTVTNAPYNGSLNTGATTSIGFNAAWNNTNPTPTTFTLNGTTCTGPGGPTTTPSTTPTTTPSTTPSTTPTGTPPPASLPCDIYAAGGTPCIAAHSTTRALYGSYNGPLYQIQRASDHGYLDVGLLNAGGVVNASPQVSFCANTTCTITKLYDQSPQRNDLPISSGGFWKGPGPNGSDIGANAMALPVNVGGHGAYGVKVTPGVGYRVDGAKGAPTGSQPEGIYMVTSSNLVNNQCCFDYGSGETSHTDTGNATMNAIYWGTACWFGGCVGSGPWVGGDLENGMFFSTQGSQKNPNYQGVHYPFVSAWEKNNGTSNFTIKYGNGQSGGLTTPFSGPLPNGYSPMKLQASILLGTGGDNSDYDTGEFFEGAVTAGYPSDATENAIQASIVAAAYQ